MLCQDLQCNQKFVSKCRYILLLLSVNKLAPKLTQILVGDICFMYIVSSENLVLMIPAYIKGS